MSTSTLKFEKFEDGQSSGLIVVVAFAILSLIAVDFVWMRLAWVVVNQILGRGTLQRIQREKTIFQSQLGAYVASLLISNFLSSVTFLFNARWIGEGGVTVGAWCNTQGVLAQVADVAGAYFTGAIAVHAFNSLVLHRRLPIWFCGLAVCFGWVVAVALALIPTILPLHSGPFYTTNGATCSISGAYPVWETMSNLVPIFVAALVSAMFYSLVYLIIRGTLGFRGGMKLNLDPESRRSTVHSVFEYPTFIAAIAKSMLWYPVAYIALVAPHIVVRLLKVSGNKISFAAIVFTSACEALLGLANVLIFYNTIRVMGPAFTAAIEEKSVSFAAGSKSDSPVDVAPPVTAFMRPAQAFPPPRSATSSLAHFRTDSSTTLGTDSTHSTRGLIARPITPVSELNQMIMSPAPAVMKEKKLFHLELGSPNPANANYLPTPRRGPRSTVTRQPTLSLADDDALAPVPLKTPAMTTTFATANPRDSFINMYATRSPIGLPIAPNQPPSASSSNGTERRLRPPALIVNDGEAAVVPSSGSGYTTSPGSEAPSSSSSNPRPSTSNRRSFRTSLRHRMSASMADIPESGLSPLAWASLVTDAAISNGGSRPSPPANTSRAEKRRSRSVDGGRLAVPSTLRPGAVPQTATLRKEFSFNIPPPRSAGLPAAYRNNRMARWDSKVVHQRGPQAQTPTFVVTAED